MAYSLIVLLIANANEGCGNIQVCPLLFFLLHTLWTSTLMVSYFFSICTTCPKSKQTTSKTYCKIIFSSDATSILTSETVCLVLSADGLSCIL